MAAIASGAGAAGSASYVGHTWVGEVETLEYKVLTEKNKGFVARFDAETIEKVLNEHAAQGWRLAQLAYNGGFGTREELLIVLERSAG